MVYGIFGVMKSAVTKTFSVGKSVTMATAKVLNRNPLFRFAFSPFYLAGKGIKMGYEGAKYGAYHAEWAGRTGVEAMKGAWGMTGRPAITLALSPLRDVKMCLWDLPIASVRAAIKTPLAILKTPVELVRGTRDAIRSTFKAATSLFTPEVFKNTRQAISDILKAPFRPIAKWLEGPAEVISTAVRTKLQYALAFKRGYEQIGEGASHIRNARQIAGVQMAAVTAQRLEKKRKIEEEKEMEKQQNLEKVQQLQKGGKGKGMGGAMPAPAPA